MSKSDIARKAVTYLLLAFVAVSVVVLIACEFKAPPAIDDTDGDLSASGGPKKLAARVVIYFFHGHKQCDACHFLRDNTKELLEAEYAGQLTAGIIEFHVINFQKPESERYIEAYGVHLVSIVLSLVKDGREAEWIDLAELWDYTDDARGLKDYVRESLDYYLERRAEDDVEDVGEFDAEQWLKEIENADNSGEDE